MPVAQVLVVNVKGLHARAAALFVKTADPFAAEIQVRRLPDDGQDPDPEYDGPVNGKSMLGLMMLAAAQGQTLEIHTQGEEAQTALDTLVALVSARFHEAE